MAREGDIVKNFWTWLSEGHYLSKPKESILGEIKSWIKEIQAIIPSISNPYIREDLEYTTHSFIDSITNNFSMFSFHTIISILRRAKLSDLANKGVRFYHELSIAGKEDPFTLATIRNKDQDDFFGGLHLTPNNYRNIKEPPPDNELGVYIRPYGVGFGKDVRTKQKLLSIYTWLKKNIVSSPHGQQLIKDLEQDFYNYEAWQVAMDIAEDLGLKTAKLRKLLNDLFVTTPPKENDYGYKHWEN